EPLSAKRGELLDDAGFGTVRQVEAAVHVGIVVAAVALEHARKPERAVGVGGGRGFAPRKAAGQRHANESARSARIAPMSASARPARMRSIGRRSPRRGLIPNSHDTAASRS